MDKQRKRVRHTETFEERLSKEAVKFKEAADKLPPGESCSRTASAASYASRDCLQHQQVAELQNFSESLLTRNREGLEIGTVAHAVHSSSNSGIPGSKRHEVLE